MKSIFIGLTSSLAGGMIGQFASQRLIEAFSYQSCTPYYYDYGLFIGTGYTCPWWHPSNWNFLLIVLGILIGPIIVKYLIAWGFNKKLYSHRIAFFLGFISILVFYIYIIVTSWLMGSVIDYI